MASESKKTKCHTGQNDKPIDCAPVGQGDYIIRSGDCISSIAADQGFFWQTIWNHAENSELKGIRGNPNVLLPGDRLTIPKIRIKEETISTESCHRFRRRGEPAQLKIQFKLYGKPRMNEAFKLEIDYRGIIEGKLDNEGKLVVGIPGNARFARILIGESNKQDVFELTLGGIDPSYDTGGAKNRLLNLGYPCPKEKGEVDVETRMAILAFQQENELNITGEFDELTLRALERAYQS